MGKLLVSGAVALVCATAVHAAEAPRVLELDMHGQRYTRDQARDPAEGVYEIQAKQKVLLSKDGSYRHSTDTRFPGNITFQFLEVGDAAGSSTVDLLKWRTGTEIQREDAARARSNYADLLFLAPAMLLEQARQRTTDGSATDTSRNETLLDAADRPATVTLDPRSGDVLRAKSTQLSYEYSDYVQRDGVRQPARITVSNGERVVARWNVTARAASPDAQAFQLPAGYVETAPKGPLRATPLASGAYRIDGTPSGYHTGFVVGTKGVAVFDAPISPEEAAKVKELIEQTAPGRKISHVILSHGHRDHIAGLPAYLKQEGIQVLLGRGGKQALQRQMGAEAANKAREITDNSEIDLGGRTIRLLPIASTHANDMLVAYDQHTRTVFHGDLFYIPEVGPIPPAFDVSVELDRLLSQHKLETRQLVGVHGRSGSYEDLQASIALRTGQQ